MKKVIQTFLVLSILCMAVNAREGRTFRQDMEEKRKQNNDCVVCCEVQSVICVMSSEQPKPLMDATAEQREMMRVYHLSVPPVIMPMERQAEREAYF